MGEATLQSEEGSLKSFLMKQRTSEFRKSSALSQGASSALTGDLNLQGTKIFLETPVSSDTGTCKDAGLSDLSLAMNHLLPPFLGLHLSR